MYSSTQLIILVANVREIKFIKGWILHPNRVQNDASRFGFLPQQIFFLFVLEYYYGKHI